MKKVRIYEYAKEVGKQSKDLITVLKDANIEVSNHMSMLTEEGLAKLDSVFKKQEEVTENEQSSNNEGKINISAAIINSLISLRIPSKITLFKLFSDIY